MVREDTRQGIKLARLIFNPGLKPGAIQKPGSLQKKV